MAKNSKPYAVAKSELKNMSKGQQGYYLQRGLVTDSKAEASEVMAAAAKPAKAEAPKA